MASHRTRLQWMGQEVETLEDLLKVGLRALCVGINPAPISVRTGHYNQGRLGQRIFQRLETARVIPPGGGGWSDDWAFAHGVGFTDIVKRPTDREREVLPDEYAYGKAELIRKIERYRPSLVVFTFKKVAEICLGRFSGNGFMSSVRIGGSDVFVMPGPYEASGSVAQTLASLRRRLDQLENESRQLLSNSQEGRASVSEQKGRSRDDD